MLNILHCSMLKSLHYLMLRIFQCSMLKLNIEILTHYVSKTHWAFRSIPTGMMMLDFGRHPIVYLLYPSILALHFRTCKRNVLHLQTVHLLLPNKLCNKDHFEDRLWNRPRAKSTSTLQSFYWHRSSFAQCWSMLNPSNLAHANVDLRRMTCCYRGAPLTKALKGRSGSVTVCIIKGN